MKLLYFKKFESKQVVLLSTTNFFKQEEKTDKTSQNN